MDMSMTSIPERIVRNLKVETRSARAFSLVEVAMAIGITAFATFALSGLIPIGIGSFQQTKNVSVASDISRQVFSDVENTAFINLLASQPAGTQSWRLPAPGAATGGSYTNSSNAVFVRNFDMQGGELASSAGASGNGVPATAIYQVNVRVACANFLQSPVAGTFTPNSNLLVVTIQVAVNPGHLPLDLDAATSSLWTGFSNATTPVQIFTFQSVVAGDPTPPVS